jgi:cation transport protein ChaC
MTTGSDPFIHHPELRDKIADPLRSSYRALDLKMLDEKMRAAGAAANWRYSDAKREETRQTALDGRFTDDLWVFAYGSLIWEPAFRFSEVRTALLKGYRRSFCVMSELGRGTPELPGLMAGLDTGDECKGLAFRINAEFVEEESRLIWRREMLMHVYASLFVPIETPLGDLEALAFVVDRSSDHYTPGLSLEKTAQYMATGVGIFGSSLTYLETLVEQCETVGIEDRALFRLRDLARQMTQENSTA